LFPCLLDAAELFESGVEGKRIDRALVEWGMPMGPLRLIDEIGVDITIDIGNTLEKAFGQRDHDPTILLWLRDQQMLGRKTGAGFYKYESKTQTPNDSLEKGPSGRHGGLERDGGPNTPTEQPLAPAIAVNNERPMTSLTVITVNEDGR